MTTLRFSRSRCRGVAKTDCRIPTLHAEHIFLCSACSVGMRKSTFATPPPANIDIFASAIGRAPGIRERDSRARRKRNFVARRPSQQLGEKRHGASTTTRGGRVGETRIESIASWDCMCICRTISRDVVVALVWRPDACRSWC